MISLPEYWSTSKIGDEFYIQQGKSLSPSSRYGDNLRPFLRTSNLSWGSIDPSDSDSMHFTSDEFDRLSVNDGDMFVCEGGDIGRCAIYRGPSGQLSYQNHLHRLRPKSERVVPDFVMYWLQAAFTQLNIYEGVGNKTTIPNLSRSRLAELSIPLPEPEEQRSISTLLRNLQASAETEETLARHLNDLKAATMTKFFRDGVRGEPSVDSELGPLPQSWKIRRLGTLAKISTGTTPATDRPEYYGGPIPFVKTAEIDNQVILSATVGITQQAVSQYNLRIYPPGTVLMAMYGQGKTRGRSAKLGVAATTTQNTAAIEPKAELLSDYLWHYLMARYEDLRGMGNLGHLSHLNLGYVKDLWIPTPDPEEQREISDTLNRLHDRIRVATCRGRAFRRLFASVLHELMTGAVRLQATESPEVANV